MMKSLIESILDDEDEVMDRMGDNILIRNFLEENYIISDYEITPDHVVNCKCLEVTLKNKSLKHLTNGQFKFGTVEGNFNCYSSNLVDLEGAPRIVKYNFRCWDCWELKTLEGGPEEVGGLFTAASCKNLISLKGSPKTTGDFACSYTEIKDLVGSPRVVKGEFVCHHCFALKSLKGHPKIIEDFISLHDNPNLKEKLSVDSHGKVRGIVPIRIK